VTHLGQPKRGEYLERRDIEIAVVKKRGKLRLAEVGNRFEKKSVHLALADIHDSIRELRFYREHLFKR